MEKLKTLFEKRYLQYRRSGKQVYQLMDVEEKKDRIEKLKDDFKLKLAIKDFNIKNLAPIVKEEE